MAYGDYGAIVYKDGERRTDREDVAVFADAGAESVGIWGHLLLLREIYGKEYPKWEMCRHAVLGDGAVRFCGYKSYPELWVMRGGQVEEIEVPMWDSDRTTWIRSGVVEVDGKEWSWCYDHHPECPIELMLIEPDGSRWEATSGYGYGD